MDGVTMPGRRHIAVAVAVTVLLGLSVGLAIHQRPGPLPRAVVGAHGYDVSWPQCSGSDAARMPPGAPSYLIVGLTNGVDETVNACLNAELDWARERHSGLGAYLAVSFPKRAQRAAAGTGMFGACGTSVRCRLRNDGATQAKAALATLHAVGLKPPILWLDVELRQVLPWSQRVTSNNDVLYGVIAALRAAHQPIGIYTTPAMWAQITGGYRLDRPNWLPTGDGSPSHAAALCPNSATGGPTWLVQYTRDLDADITCPPLRPRPGPRHVQLSRIVVEPGR
jgi:hypothetical protein